MNLKTSKPEIRPRKMPRQERSAFTVRTLLEAAARVLATESLAGFTTNRVAEVAGVSIGSLYQYFPSKDALVAALIADDQDRLARDVENCVAHCASASIEVAIEQLVDIAIQYQWGNPLYAAALDHEEQRLPVNDTLQQSRVRIVKAVAHMLKTHTLGLDDVYLMQTAKDLVVISKAMVEAESSNVSKTALHERIVRTLIVVLQRSETSIPTQA